MTDPSGGGPRRRFAIDYRLWRWLLVSMGLGPRSSWAVLDDHSLTVTMGWAFRVTVPRSSIHNPSRGKASLGIGVHADLRGGWLVNGSLRGIVWMDVHPAAPGRSAGFPIRVKRLGVGVTEPDALIAALGGT